MTLLTTSNLPRLFAVLDGLCLTDDERELATRKVEDRLESSIKHIHQRLYDDERMRNMLGMNEKLYLFCGLIMAGLSANGVPELKMDDFKGLNDTEHNDGKVVLDQVRLFLRKKNCDAKKLSDIVGMLTSLFMKIDMWRPEGGVSMIKALFL